MSGSINIIPVVFPSYPGATTLRLLADRAMRLYPPGNKAISQAAYEIQVEQAFREVVHEVGGIFTVRKSIALVDGQREYIIPTDFRQFFNNGISIGETAIDA